MPRLIYHVEDDPSIRELIQYALVNAGFEVKSFESAEEMLSAFSLCLPDLVILDIMLPGTDGIEALKAIRAHYAGVGVKVFMLTAKASEVNKITGLDYGADDYITKPFSVLELIARVRAHLRQAAAPLKDGTIVAGGIKLNPSAHTVFSDEAPVELTGKEFELLYALVKKAGEVIKREDLVRDIWGYEYFGDSRTVDIHIKNLRGKLGKNGDCIVSIRGVGYKLVVSLANSE
ncbi:MAG: response regulator transcription factor [Firmicutes bacterium]|nr:response regulator transcription factor [Bacillota bacterium]